MVSVFLSHSSKDKPFVIDLARALRDGGGMEVWLDGEQIDYGENIVGKIGGGLDADFVLLILSPDAVDSEWVKEEWTAAYWKQVNSRRTKLAGVLYRECRIPNLLENKKYFDLTKNRSEGFRTIRTWLLGQASPPPPMTYAPPLPEIFITRTLEVETLKRKLQTPGSVACITGVSGRGKTRLAMEYAADQLHTFEAVYWLSCEGRTLAQIAGELAWQIGENFADRELDSMVRELKGRCGGKRCLLVFDNVENDIPAPLLPGGRASVLMTTQLRDLAFLPAHRPLELTLFSE